jgi:hypothetical protein
MSSGNIGQTCGAETNNDNHFGTDGLIFNLYLTYSYLNLLSGPGPWPYTSHKSLTF